MQTQACLRDGKTLKLQHLRNAEEITAGVDHVPLTT